MQRDFTEMFVFDFILAKGSISSLLIYFLFEGKKKNEK